MEEEEEKEAGGGQSRISKHNAQEKGNWVQEEDIGEKGQRKEAQLCSENNHHVMVDLAGAMFAPRTVS